VLAFSLIKLVLYILTLMDSPERLGASPPAHQGLNKYRLALALITVQDPKDVLCVAASRKRAPANDTSYDLGTYDR